MWKEKARFTVDCREVANVHDIRTDTSFQAKTNAKVVLTHDMRGRI